MKLLTLFTILIAVNVISGYKKRSQTCIYPNGDKGTCTRVTDCPKLLDIEEKLDESDVVKIFGKILCSTEDAGNKICCPEDSQRDEETSNSDSKCINPKGDEGTCVPIEECQPLQILQLYQKKRGVSSFLSASVCGNSQSMPMVCCPAKAIAQFQQILKKPETYINSTQSEPFEENTLRTGSKTRLPGLDECGHSPFYEGMVDLYHIIGGKDSMHGDWPWMAALGYMRPDGSFSYECSGTIITNQHILTAAHCFRTASKLSMVRMGDFNLYSSLDDDYVVNERVGRIIVHKDHSSTKRINDIAIVKLRKPVQYSGFIMPICLPQRKLQQPSDFENRELHIVGWGQTETNERGSPILKDAIVKGVSEQFCKGVYSQYNSIIDERVLCAGNLESDGPDACRGDSGGPIMDYQKKRFFQEGIISYGLLCGNKGAPGIYTRVSAFMDWIVKVVDEA